MPRVAGDVVARPPKLSPAPNTNSGDEVSSSSSETNSKSKSGGVANYTAPQWLLLEKQTAKFFSLPIPPVPTATFQAVEAFMGGPKPTSRKNSTLVLLEQKVRQLQQEQKAQRQKTKAFREKLATTLATKEQGIADIRKVREDEIQDALHELERTMRTQHDKQYEEQHEQLQQQVMKDFEQDLERQRAKRQLEAEEEEATYDEQAARAKKSKVDDDTKRKSDEIQQQMDDLQTKQEKLTEKKSEMVWLLKQMIKADAKRKMGMMRLKKKTEAAAKH